MSILDKQYELMGNKLVEQFKKRNMTGYYVATKEEALKKALELIPEGSVVSWGGSQTINEIGLRDAVINGNYKVIDRDSAATPEEGVRLAHEALNSEYYLMSTNAITADGKLINIDGNSNRVAALAYGPEHVIIIAGINKVAPDDDSAMKRARNTAAPLNNLRLDRKNPCSTDGLCHDCTSDDCICCQVLITRVSRHKDRIYVILVGESLGF